MRPQSRTQPAAVRRAQSLGMRGQTLSAGGHASSLPRGLKLPKGALSTVLFGSQAPAGLRVLVKRTHIESLLLLPRSYDLRYRLPTSPACCLA